MKIIDRPDIDRLFAVLQQRGYELVGPSVHEHAIVYDEIDGSADLPVGWTDRQDAGHYRLQRRDDEALFGYVVGPQSWKKYLYPPEQRLFRAHKTADGMRLEADAETPPKRAFIGVRACELSAIAIQDKVFGGGLFRDGSYQARRDRVFLLAVNCTEPGGTCFCTSMNTGPRASAGFDLVLTEVLDGERHYFAVETGTPAGEQVLAATPHREADAAISTQVDALCKQAAQRMGRTMDNSDLKDLLYRNLEHPRWEEVAGRCLNCANCTLVCPTCFCSTVEDNTDLAGATAERTRRWDSCFNQDFSYIVGGNIRSSARSRYRQWMTHKLASWYDQFGSSGCVGCGRCISWCPVGIDITEEARAIRDSDGG